MRRRRIPRQLQPVGIQLSYLAELRKLVAFMHRLVRERLIRRLPELLDRAEAHGLHADFHGAESNPGEERADAQAPSKRANSIMRQVEAAFARAYPQARLEQIAERVARATSAHQKAQLENQLRAAVGVDAPSIIDRKLTPRVAQFTAENVALIKTVPASYFGEVEKIVTAGIGAGDRASSIAGDIEERTGAAEERAKLIARDQVLSFQADLNEARQAALGVERYIWRTVEDQRVRDEHQERDGEEYSWADPPGDDSDPGDGANPGDGINCRCSAEPVLDDLIADLTD